MTEGDFKAAQIIKEQVVDNELQISKINDSIRVSFGSFNKDKTVENGSGSVIYEDCKKIAIKYYLDCNRKLNAKFEALGK